MIHALEYLDLIDAQDWGQDSNNEKEKIEHPIRDWQNPMQAYSEVEFRRKFRFTKGITFHVLLPTVLDSLKNHGLSLSPLLQLLVALRWFACGSFQHVVSDTVTVSQPSVCRIVRLVARSLAGQRARFVTFPTEDEARLERQKFQRVAGFPGVIGCIDGCHVKISKPAGEQEAEIYRNRKGCFSINVQAVCRFDLSFSNVVCRWPGSTHDYRIFENSRLNTLLRSENAPEGHLLGDGGYASLNYMVIPFRENEVTTAARRRYNAAHIKTRNFIERAFGILKKRFYCIGSELRTHLDNSLAIIVACFVLHNIAIQYKQPLEQEEWQNNDDNDDDAEEDLEILENAVGLAYREQIVQTHFSRPGDDEDMEEN